ncbi:hypothetical protein ACHAW5_002611 [Stephanodiscus triporus]|uniref:Kinesin light chain n=1 Tax=Stephanodiscus triporus TaxID=2934178 RepID=A0ABD3NMG9_9STRA
MPSIYSQDEASKDASLSTPTRSKSLRKVLSSKLPGFAHADRSDTATPRGGQSNGRDPPAGITVDDSEISKFNDKGNEFFGTGEYDAALRMYSEALKLLKQPNIIMDLEGDGNELMSEAMRRIRTARCLVNIGAVHIRREDFDDAISALELSLRQTKLVMSSSSLYYRACEVKADAAENIGLVFFKQKDYEQCSVMYTDALEARRKCLDLMEAKHKKWGRRSKDEARQYKDERNAVLLELSVTLFYTTLLLERLGDMKGAVESCEEAIRLRREVIPDSKQDPNSLNLFSTIGRLYCHESVKRHGNALGYFHEVHRMKCEISGRDHLDVVPSLNYLASIYKEIGDYKRSAILSDRAIEIATNGRGLNKQTCIAYTNLGDASKFLKDYEKAIDSYETALKTQSQLFESNDMMNAEVLEKLAEVYLLSKDNEKAIFSMEKSLYVKMKNLGPESQVLARSHSKLGDIYEAGGQHSNGINCHTRALRIFKHHDNKEMAATEHNKIATILKKSGENTKAMEHYMAALWHSREARLPSTDPIVADTIRNVAAFQQV